jgi:hypothetical protein
MHTPPVLLLATLVQASEQHEGLAVQPAPFMLQAPESGGEPHVLLDWQTWPPEQLQG